MTATGTGRSEVAVARPVTGERTLVVLLGAALLIGGVLVLLLWAGVFGTARASRPVLDPLIVEAVLAQPVPARLIAIGAGLSLVGLGIVWTAHTLRPEPRPDLVLDPGPDDRVVVTAAAVAEAVGTHAAGLAGVTRARARLVGTAAAPTLRITLWLTDDADVRGVLARLDTEVRAAACACLDLPTLPTAVWLELEPARPGPRVT